MSKMVSTFIKIGVTLLGLWIVSREVPFADVWAQIQTARWEWLLLALVLMILSLVLRALRWRSLLVGAGAVVAFGRLVQLYFIGNFFNAFLLSGMGGDVVRAIEVSEDVSAEVAAGTVIVDRMTGLLSLFAMALASLPFRPANFPNELLSIIVSVSILGLTGGFVLLDGRIIRMFDRWMQASASNGLLARLIRKHLLPIFNTVQGCGWPAVWQALTISLLFNVMFTTWWWLVGQALGLEVAFSYYLLIVPLLSLAQLVPSFSGLGVREALAPTLFAGAGVAGENAVALSLTVLVLLRTTSLLGAPVYLLRTIKRGG
ncbi:MAG: lysylphosphatidylglycerol synthase transmembrane domain-containing protein [Candidatus Promineifilaceae bacterium]